MKAVIRDVSKMYLSEVQRDEKLADDELLVKIDKVGICRTDIYVGEGKIPVNKPTILGHECSAYVVKKGGNVHDLEVGELVAINPLMPCKECVHCEKDQPYLCPNAQLIGVEMDGCLVKQMKVHQKNVLKVDQTLDSRLVAYVEPVAAALSIFNAGITKSEQGVILGKNRFTHLLSLILAHKGFKNIQLIENVSQLQANRFDYVLETGLQQQDFQTILDKIKPQGKVIIRSRSYQYLCFSPKQLIAKEIQLKGVNYGSFEEAVQLIQEMQEVLLPLMGNVFDFSDFEEAFQVAKTKDDVKYFIQV